MAKGELERAVPFASSVQRAILAGDDVKAEISFEAMSSHARQAASLTSDPVWRMFEVLPLIGPNLEASRQLAQVVKNVSLGVVGPVVQLTATTDLAGLSPQNGAIDLKPLIEARPILTVASQKLAIAQSQIGAIDTTRTVGPVRRAAAQLSVTLAESAHGIDAATRAVTLLPEMLGSNGPRKYLLLFQNNAELRATGGLPGAMALIATSHGSIHLERQATGASVGPFYGPVLELPTETRGIFSDRLSTFMGDVTLTPNFSTTGQLAREMWKRQFGDEVDGVLSIDPIALSYLLRATGPITLSTGDVLTSDNSVQKLLIDAYWQYDSSDEQDAFFAAAASAVFDALSHGHVEPRALLVALAQASDERRVLVWSARTSDQQLLAGTNLAGELPASDASAERFGVYLNDATGAKMDTYLDVQIGVGEVSCRADGRPYYAVDVTLTNTAPVDAATALPESITGPGTYGVQQGNIGTLILVYGPKDSQNLGMAQGGERVPYHPAIDSGSPVSQIGVELVPGQSLTTRAYFLGGAKLHGDLVVVSTPVIRPNPRHTVDLSCAGSIG